MWTPRPFGARAYMSQPAIRGIEMAQVVIAHCLAGVSPNLVKHAFGTDRPIIRSCKLDNDD